MYVCICNAVDSVKFKEAVKEVFKKGVKGLSIRAVARLALQLLGKDYYPRCAKCAKTLAKEVKNNSPGVT